MSGQSGERTINKSASQPFIGANQPSTTRLGWNSEISGQAKAKQDEVRLWWIFRKVLSSKTLGMLLREGFSS